MLELKISQPSDERLPDEEVKVKVSSCGKCKGIVRAAVEHKMDTKSRNAFMKEVMKYDLAVTTVPLLEFRKSKPDWCEC